MGEDRENCKREEDTGSMDLRKFNWLDSRNNLPTAGPPHESFLTMGVPATRGCRLRLIGCRGGKGEAAGEAADRPDDRSKN